MCLACSSGVFIPDLNLLPSLPVHVFEGTVYRVVLKKRQNNILSTEGNRFFPGRYHLINETGILYTSLNEGTAIREVKRHMPVEGWDEELVSGTVHLKLNKVLDLTDGSVLKKLGLTEEDLRTPDWSLTQAISFSAKRAGLEALIVPSATGEGKNLIVFEDNFGEGCSLRVVRIRFL